MKKVKMCDCGFPQSSPIPHAHSLPDKEKKLTAEELVDLIVRRVDSNGELDEYGIKFCVEDVKSAEQAARNEGRKEALDEIERLKSALMDHNKVIQTSMLTKAFRAGAESMRERAAKWAEKRKGIPEHHSDIAKGIRILPISSEDAGKQKEVLYSGQCRHQIPIGQPCKECHR